MSFFSTLAKVFPSNTIAHKIFDKGDSLLNRVAGGVLGTAAVNTVGGEAGQSVKQMGIDVVSAYSKNMSNAITGTSASISNAAAGSVQITSIVDILLKNWFIVLAAIALFMLLKSKK